MCSRLLPFTCVVTDQAAELCSFFSPVADLWVFDSYYCELSTTEQGIHQRLVGRIVAAREVVYLATTLCAACACPVFLLLDITAVWKEERCLRLRVSRIAAYLVRT